MHQRNNSVDFGASTPVIALGTAALNIILRCFDGQADQVRCVETLFDCLGNLYHGTHGAGMTLPKEDANCMGKLMIAPAGDRPIGYVLASTAV